MKNIIIALFLSILFTANSFACSCMMPNSPEESKNFSSNVFIGKVTKIEKDSFVNELIGKMTRNKINFKIESNIKGYVDDFSDIYTSEYSASCGYNFKEAEEYIVYANDNNGDLNVSLCSRTSLLINAGEDLEAFKTEIEEGKVDTGINYQEKDKNNYLLFIVGLLALISFIFTFIKYFNKK